MSQFIIEGGNKLKGRIKISGNKNSILPCMAACLLSEEEVVLKNVPNISDVGVFVEVLHSLGASVEVLDHELKINCQGVTKTSLPKDLVTKVRASILFVGPLLSRFGKADFFHPGGDVIGKRSIETHILGFKSLGFNFKADDLSYRGWRGSKKDVSVEVFLDEASVTATENLILGSVLSDKKIVLKNTACEPHVVDLCNLLNKMGAKIEGVGSATLKITGVKKLSAADFTIGSDYIEFGTYAIAAAITQGEIEIENLSLDGLEPVIRPLQKMGIIFSLKDGGIKVSINKSIYPYPKLITNIWPGFPTDLMSAAIVLASQAKGVSLMHDWMYESRMFFVDKLISMGASITIADPHRVIISGPTKLRGRVLETPDIRAGMALVLASLIASGQSVINRAELIERGYEDVIEKLSSLGANIQKID